MRADFRNNSSEELFGVQKITEIYFENPKKMLRGEKKELQKVKTAKSWDLLS